MQRVLIHVVGVISIAAFGLSAATHAAYIANFESGYSAGALAGQNGWTSPDAPGFEVGSTYGKGGTWGARITASGWSSSQVAHGQTFSAGEVWNFEWDMKRSGDSRLGGGPRTGGGPLTEYFATEFYNAGGPDQVHFHGYYGGSPIFTNFFDTTVPEEWMHLKITWTVGTSARLVVTTESGAPFYDSGVEAYTDLAAMSHIHFEGRDGGGAIDNIQIALVPEPSTMTIVGLGACTLALHRRRR